MHKKVQSRRAIAMVELIFAIVIIGITLLSVPNLIYQASESGYTTIQQESIAAAASDLSLILSREWDEVGTSDAFNTPILNTNSTTSSLEDRPAIRSRVYTTGLGGGKLNASAIGPDASDIDDIDDADGVTGALHSMGGAQDLIDINITIATVVDYIGDATSTGGDWNNSTALTFNFSPTATGSKTVTSNIKKVKITLTSNSPAEELSDKEIVFNAFSCNIGSYKLERREF